MSGHSEKIWLYAVDESSEEASQEERVTTESCPEPYKFPVSVNSLGRPPTILSSVHVDHGMFSQSHRPSTVCLFSSCQSSLPGPPTRPLLDLP